MKWEIIQRLLNGEGVRDEDGTVKQERGMLFGTNDKVARKGKWMGVKEKDRRGDD